jgi:phosphoribosylaminoimidazole-succinocarboxamide synthase
MKALTHKVNAILKPLFANAGIDLVDYKLEFGHPTEDPQGRLVLGDEFTPTAAGSGTLKRARRWTRIASGAISEV